ncbi:unnamed protein product [Ectocarpus sp. CCAP 1310/34]|nr:unnamed protein product [Ectocarpus sp. CCAP 1310/34]
MDSYDLRHAGEEGGELRGSFSPVLMRRMFDDVTPGAGHVSLPIVGWVGAGQVPGEDVRAGTPTDSTASDEDSHVDDEAFDCCPAEVCVFGRGIGSTAGSFGGARKVGG